MYQPSGCLNIVSFVTRRSVDKYFVKLLAQASIVLSNVLTHGVSVVG